MSDEQILFNITDGGSTDKFMAALNELGDVGAKAIDRLNSELEAYTNPAMAAADTQKILNTYLAAGGQEAENLLDVLRLLTDVELQEADASAAFTAALQRVGVAEQAVTQRIRENIAALQDQKAETLANAQAMGDAVLAQAEQAAKALAQEDEAYSIHYAMLKEQATSSAYSINASYDLIASGADKVSVAMKAAAASGASATAMLKDLIVQAAIEEEAALSALAAQEKVAADLRVQAEIEASLKISAALKTEEEAWAQHTAFLAQQSATATQATIAAAQEEANAINASRDKLAAADIASANMSKQAADLRVQAALEEEAKISEALKTEEAAWAEHGAFIKDAMMSEASAINVAYDSQIAAVAKAAAEEKVQQDLRVQAAISAELGISNALKMESEAWAEHVVFVKEQVMAEATAINEGMLQAEAATASAAAKINAQAGALGTGFFAAAKQIAGFVAVTATVHAIDAIDSINQELQSVVGAGKDTTQIFTSIANTANATQTPLATVAKSFASVYSAIKQGGGTVQQAEGFVNSLSRALFDTQTPTAAAQKVLHDFSEGLATGSLNGRQLTSVLMQAPAVMGLVSDALGKNVESMTTHAQAATNATTRLQQLEAAANDTGESVGTAGSKYTEAATKTQAYYGEIDKANDKLQNIGKTLGTTSAAYTTQQQVVDKLTSAQAASRAATSADAIALDQAKTKQDAATQSKIAYQKAIVANLSGLSQEAILTVFQSQKMQDALNGLATTAGGTLTGSFTVLNNKFEQYLNVTGDANVVTGLFVKALGFMGNNLNIVIPLIVAYGAKIALVKLTEFVSSIYAWATAQKAVNVQLALTDALSAPWLIAIVGIAAAIAAVITVTGQWGTVMSGLQAIWAGTVATWTAVVNGVGDAWAYVVKTVTPLTDQIMPLWNSLTKDLYDDWQQIKQEWTEITTILGGLSSSTTHWADTWTSLKADVSDFINVVVKGVGSEVVGAIELAIGVLKTMEDVIYLIVAGIQKAIDLFNYFKGIGGGGSSGSGTSATTNGSSDGGGAPLSRDGSNFTVGGTGGVDSQLIRVSPGEHVTVQTPMQAKMGAVNDNLPKFRDGGVFKLDDLTAAFKASTTGSTTGYGTISPSAYYTSGTDAAATTSTSATSVSDTTSTSSTSAGAGVISLSNTLAPGLSASDLAMVNQISYDNTLHTSATQPYGPITGHDYFGGPTYGANSTAGLAATGHDYFGNPTYIGAIPTGTTPSSYAALQAAAAASSATSSSSTDTDTSDDTAPTPTVGGMQMGNGITIVGRAANGGAGVGSIGIPVGDVLDSAGNAYFPTSIPGIANTVGQTGTTGGGMNVVANTNYLLGQSPSEISKATALANDQTALQAANVITSIGGASKPAGDGGWSASQAQNWQLENGVVVPKPGTDPSSYTFAGDHQAAAQKLDEDQNKPASSFRDGGDFMVPGSSGVDTRAIQLAVSPGETVSVRTPQQKQASQDALNAGRKSLQTPVIHVNVQATDVNSFSMSQAQIASKLKQQLSRVA